MRKHSVILLAEDNRGDTLLVQRAFRQLDAPYVLNVVEHGDAAVDYLAGNGTYADRDRYPLPALLLLDLKMPRRSGFEVMEWLQHQSDIELPVVILTSSTDPSEMQRAYQLGAKSYILKPLTLDMLLPLLKFAEISP
jgi:CheY-like chemotaxis protein